MESGVGEGVGRKGERASSTRRGASAARDLQVVVLVHQFVHLDRRRKVRPLQPFPRRVGDLAVFTQPLVAPAAQLQAHAQGLRHSSTQGERGEQPPARENIGAALSCRRQSGDVSRARMPAARQR